MTDIPSEDLAQVRAAELARRLTLLVDAVRAETGEKLTFPTIEKELAERGIHISAGRWSYMLSGTGPLTTDLRLLSALADIFQVPREYLLSWELDGLPDRIDAQLELIKKMREEKLASLVARTLGPLSADTLRALSKAVDDSTK